MILRLLCLVCVLGPAARAGVIQGVVLENGTGLPLARTRVKLEALGDARLEMVATLLSGRSGQFSFSPLRDGYYLLTASRAGFADGNYGQKRSNSPAVPILVAGDAVVFAEIRLKRFGAVSGRVFDENRVGLLGVPVLAYAAGVPLRIVSSGKTDDRGVYRISGLMPGRYYVRTGALELEDRTALLPTFSRETALAREAVIIRADLDAEMPEVHVHPLPGRLASLRGVIGGCPPGGSATVTLTSDTGLQQTSALCGGGYSFPGLAPADYQLLAQSGDGESRVSAFQQIFVSSEGQGANLALRPDPRVLLQVRDLDGHTFDPGEVPVLVRRKHLAGEEEVIRFDKRQLRLAPGYWEITARPPASHYLDSVEAGSVRRARSKPGENPDWYNILLETGAYEQVIVTLGTRPATLGGRVTHRGDPVPGAPVFLYPATPEARRRMNGARTVRTGAKGVYRFEGIAPGRYQVLSSFDFSELDEEILEEARPPSILLDEGKAGALDLTLFEWNRP